MQVLILDTETNGKPRAYSVRAVEQPDAWPRLVQVAWQFADIPDGQVDVATQCRLVMPDGWEIPEQVTAIHGITTDHAREHGELISGILMELLPLIHNADLVVAHNEAFDRNVLVGEFYREFDHAIAGEVDKKPWLCTMTTTTELVGIPGRYGAKWPTLAELHYALFRCRPEEQAHRADQDVITLAKCFRELVKRGHYANVFAS